MDNNYNEIARGCEADCWVHGRVNNGAAVAVSTNGYTLSHRSGTNYASSPYTDSIPTDCGGIIECGLWAVIDPPTAGQVPAYTEFVVDGTPLILVGPGLYQAVSMPGYTDIDRGDAMPGDRGAFDVHNYPEEHASDTHEGVSILHLDPDAAAGEGPVMGPDGKYLYEDIATQDELDTHEGTPDAHHDPVTLGAGNDADMATLSTQALTVTLKDHDHTGDSGDGGQITVAAIDSETATSGQVATADGVGGTAWQTVSAASGEVLMQDGVTAPPVPIETEAQDDWLYEG
jgi:hypothetical protein